MLFQRYTETFPPPVAAPPSSQKYDVAQSATPCTLHPTPCTLTPHPIPCTPTAVDCTVQDFTRADTDHTVDLKGFVTSRFEGYVAKFAQHQALKLIVSGKMTFGDRVAVHREVGAGPAPTPSGIW